MAFSNTYDTINPGSAVSNREDLTDILSILAPQETPVLSLAKKRRATGRYHEWTVDSLSSPVTTGVTEGADVSTFDDKFQNRARLGNYVQKFRRSYMVSDIQNAVDSVGPAKIAQAEAKAVREIKRDIEAALCSTNDRDSGSDGVPSVLRGLGSWISSSGPSDVPSTYRTPAGSINGSGTAFTETVFNNLITSMYRVTGHTNSITLVADTALRRLITDFARTSASGDYSVRKVEYSGGDSTIKLSVEMYHSDHGIVEIVNMNPDCAPDTTNKDTGYLLNTDYLGVADLIPLGSTRLPNLGGGERGYVDYVGTLEVLHPGAFGSITALS